MNGQNQITTSGKLTLSYGANGNITNDGVNSYTYGIANNLTAMNTSVSLSYDPLDRLVTTTGSSETQFAYSGGQVVGEYSSTGGLLRRYVPKPPPARRRSPSRCSCSR